MSSLGDAVTLATATARSEQAMDPVKIVAGDGTEIILDRKAALVSGTIKAMLAGAGELDRARHARTRDMHAHALPDATTTHPIANHPSRRHLLRDGAR